MTETETPHVVLILVDGQNVVAYRGDKEDCTAFCSGRGKRARRMLNAYPVIYCGPESGEEWARLRLGESFDGIHAQLVDALAHYPNADGLVRWDSVKPVPRPDYEAEYGGPYQWIISVRYNAEWGACFGVRTDGQIVLWMD
jgi:hypothetical protein